MVDGQLWTDESVFWQLKVKDRGEYEVVHRKSLPPWFVPLFSDGKGNHGSSKSSRKDTIDIFVLCGILKYLEHLESQRELHLRSKSYVDRHAGQMNISYLKNMELTGGRKIHGMGSQGFNFILICIMSLLLPIQRFLKLDFENDDFSSILILVTHTSLYTPASWALQF